MFMRELGRATGEEERGEGEAVRSAEGLEVGRRTGEEERGEGEGTRSAEGLEVGRGEALRPRVGAGEAERGSVALRARKACCSALRPLAAGAL